MIYQASFLAPNWLSQLLIWWPRLWVISVDAKLLTSMPSLRNSVPDCWPWYQGVGLSSRVVAIGTGLLVRVKNQLGLVWVMCVVQWLFGAELCYDCIGGTGMRMVFIGCIWDWCCIWWMNLLHLLYAWLLNTVVVKDVVWYCVYDLAWYYVCLMCLMFEWILYVFEEDEKVASESVEVCKCLEATKWWGVFEFVVWNSRTNFLKGGIL